MNIELSWDLFIFVFFIIIVAYSFIIGRDNTLKVILGTYVAALAADAAGSLFAAYFGGSAFFVNLLKLAAVNGDSEATVFVKVTVFVVLVILFAVRGAFEVSTAGDRSAAVRLILSIVYAIMSAGLIISTILVFVSGVSFIGGGNPDTTNALLADIAGKSQLISTMLSTSYFWFFVPAFTFLIQSLKTTSPGE